MLDVVAEVDEAVLVVVVPVWVVVVPVLVAAEAELAELEQVASAVGKPVVTPTLEQILLASGRSSVTALAVSCVFDWMGAKRTVLICLAVAAFLNTARDLAQELVCTRTLEVGDSTVLGRTLGALSLFGVSGRL